MVCHEVVIGLNARLHLKLKISCLEVFSNQKTSILKGGGPSAFHFYSVKRRGKARIGLV
jgi:hypothetical protein